MNVSLSFPFRLQKKKEKGYLVRFPVIYRLIPTDCHTLAIEPFCDFQSLRNLTSMGKRKLRVSNWTRCLPRQCPSFEACSSPSTRRTRRWDSLCTTTAWTGAPFTFPKRLEPFSITFISKRWVQSAWSKFEFTLPLLELFRVNAVKGNTACPPSLSKAWGGSYEQGYCTIYFFIHEWKEWLLFFFFGWMHVILNNCHEEKWTFLPGKFLMYKLPCKVDFWPTCVRPIKTYVFPLGHQFSVYWFRINFRVLYPDN